MKRTALPLMVALVAATLFAASQAVALNPAKELYVPAVARAAGAAGSHWFTDLYVFNPGTAAVSVKIYFLPRSTDNSNVTPFTYDLAAGETLTLPDVLQGTFGEESAAGAFRIVATGPVVANCRVYNKAGTDTFGQGLEGVPASAAVVPGHPTDIVGLASNGTDPGTFRSNVFAVNTSSTATTLTLSLLDSSGSTVASKSYTLEPYAALYAKVTDFGVGDFDSGTLHAAVESGSAIVVAAKNDNGSSDGTTLEPWWNLGGTEPEGPAGKYIGNVYNADGYIRGGITVYLDDSGNVTYVGWRTEPKSACIDVDMPGWEDLSANPVPFSQFATGHTVTNDYTSWGSTFGQIQWTLKLSWRGEGENRSIEGTLVATGSGFSGITLSCLNDTGDQHSVVAAKLLPPEGS